MVSRAWFEPLKLNRSSSSFLPLPSPASFASTITEQPKLGLSSSMAPNQARGDLFSGEISLSPDFFIENPKIQNRVILNRSTAPSRSTAPQRPSSTGRPPPSEHVLQPVASGITRSALSFAAASGRLKARGLSMAASSACVCYFSSADQSKNSTTAASTGWPPPPRASATAESPEPATSGRLRAKGSSVLASSASESIASGRRSRRGNCIDQLDTHREQALSLSANLKNIEKSANFKPTGTYGTFAGKPTQQRVSSQRWSGSRQLLLLYIAAHLPHCYTF